MSPYQVRAALVSDLAAFGELAGFLNTVNLPDDPTALQHILQRSETAFEARRIDPRRAQYVFALQDTRDGRVVGTSALFGQLGRRDAPYIYFDVREDEHYSSTLDRHFVHKVLNIGFSYDGPTELGGLVVHPNVRGSSHRLGTMIACVRFLWLAMRRELFRDQVLAELLPPLEPDGTSHLWQAVGHHFTGLSYREADRLSRNNKEFIRGLFPAGDIYVALLSPKAQAVLGEVGQGAKAVERLLHRVGFRYAHRVDPFDGGPHFVAATDDIPLVREAYPRRVQIERPEQAVVTDGVPALVGARWEEPPYFLALPGRIVPGTQSVRLGAQQAQRLGIKRGASVWSMPLP